MKVACIGLLALALLPSQSFACMPVAGVDYKGPTESELFEQADVVFSGQVVAMAEAPELREVSQHSYPYRYVVRVMKWLKGTGGGTPTIFDTTGTDCDVLFGVSHLFIPDGSRLPSAEFRVYARRSQGRLWVITAYPVVRRSQAN